MNTIIEKIRAEIERLKEEAYNSISPDEPKYRTHYKVGKKELCEELLSFLSDIEKECEEKPTNIDFEQELYNHFGQVKDFTLGMQIGKYFYELGQQSKPKVRFPHEEDIVYKVFGAGNLDGWEYDEAKALVALAKEELLKDIKPKVSEGLEEEIETFTSRLCVVRGSVQIVEEIARHFAKWQKEQDDKELSEKIAFAYQLGLYEKERQMMKEGTK